MTLKNSNGVLQNVTILDIIIVNKLTLVYAEDKYNYLNMMVK